MVSLKLLSIRNQLLQGCSLTSTVLFPLNISVVLISSLVHCLHNICFNYENFQAQLEVFRQILNCNSYPLPAFFDSCARTFLDKVSQPKPIVLSVSKKVLYFSLPYTGKHSLQIHTQISRLCSSAYPHLNIRFVFCLAFMLVPFFPQMQNSQSPKILSGLFF